MSIRFGNKIIVGTGTNIATPNELGVCKPDNDTISIDSNGVISANLSMVDAYTKNETYTKQEIDTTLASSIPTKVSDLTNDAGYITEQIDISGKADKSDTYTKQEVDNKFTEFNPDLSSCYTKEQTDSLLANKANTSDIPDTSSFVTISELSNKQDKLTPGTGISIQNNVITCTVQQQDLSNYYTKSQIDTMIGNIDDILDYILGV